MDSQKKGFGTLLSEMLFNLKDLASAGSTILMRKRISMSSGMRINENYLIIQQAHNISACFSCPCSQQTAEQFSQFHPCSSLACRHLPACQCQGFPQS